MFLASDVFRLLSSKYKKLDLVVGASFFEIYSGKVSQFCFVKLYAYLNVCHLYRHCFGCSFSISSVVIIVLVNDEAGRNVWKLVRNRKHF